MGLTALFTLLAFSAGGYFGYQLNDGGEATQQREAGVMEVPSCQPLVRRLPYWNR